MAIYPPNQKKEVKLMYKYFIVENGKYSHAFKSIIDCLTEGKLISAIYRREVYVVNDRTGEIMAIYDTGLRMD